LADISRTERDFQRALLHLLEDHTFLSLSVEQICQETMMHRSSFYRYFNDKYDLLKHTVNTKITNLIDESDSSVDELANVVDYLCSHKDIMRNLASSNSNSSLYPTMVNILADIMLTRYESGVDDRLVKVIGTFDNPETTAYMLSASIVGAFYWWRNQDYATPKETIIKHANRFIDWLTTKSSHE
jgi:AcrR family transcriptional regulator